MVCKKCGALLEEDSMFCANCGTKVEAAEQPAPAAAPVPAPAAAPETAVPAPIAGKPKFKLAKESLIGLVVGTIFVLIGLIQVVSAGTSISPTSFGGDFYTYTYRGIVAISEQLASIQAGIGWVIAAIGAAIDVRALRS